MKVTVLEPSGYCSGVERAMNIAIETKANNPSKNVVVLGMLVHNEDSLKKLEDKGISTIYKANCSLEQMVDEIKTPSLVILTAHGHSKNLEQVILSKGHKIIDATCPFVSNSFAEISKAITESNKVLYIGVKNHPEANAALSISKDVTFVNAKTKEIPLINSKSPMVISQTTLSSFEIQEIIDSIKAKYPDAKFLNGICNASTSRQKALMNVGEDVDLIYIVGGSNSNNTKTLYNLANNLYKNKVVKVISNETEINKKDLIGLSHIAISSGASTPKEVIERVKKVLLN